MFRQCSISIFFKSIQIWILNRLTPAARSSCRNPTSRWGSSRGGSSAQTRTTRGSTPRFKNSKIFKFGMGNLSTFDFFIRCSSTWTGLRRTGDDYSRIEKILLLSLWLFLYYSFLTTTKVPQLERTLPSYSVFFFLFFVFVAKCHAARPTLSRTSGLKIQKILIRSLFLIFGKPTHHHWFCRVEWGPVHAIRVEILWLPDWV